MELCGINIGGVDYLNLHYNSISTEWTEYTIDISKHKGIVTVIFKGGYYDKTGSSASNTQYCNIRLIP